MLVCVHMCERSGVPRGVLTHLNGGLGAALFLISPALCGFPPVTGLRVETGTNEQLHPAWLPGIMGLQTVSGSISTFFLHFPFAICSFHPLFGVAPFYFSFLIFHSGSSVLIPLYPVCVWIKYFRTLLNYG